MKIFKILAIDDEEMFAHLVKMNLEKGGEFEVRIETDSTKAEQVAMEYQPDLILLDIIMPEMDGGEVAARFRENAKLQDIPVILMTALMSPQETNAQGYKDSPTGMVLPKPINIETLTKCIHEALGEVEL